MTVARLLQTQLAEAVDIFIISPFGVVVKRKNTERRFFMYKRGSAELRKTKDVYELNSEIMAVSSAISGLSYTLDEENCDRLTGKGMREALYGLTCH